MGVRYRGEFNSYANVAYKVDILDTAYSSTVNEFSIAKPGVVIRYDGADRFDPIITSSAQIYFTIRTSGDRGFIESIVAAQNYRFTVKIYKGGSLHWIGAIDTSEIIEEDKTYSIVKLTALDGLRFLKTSYLTTFSGEGTEHTYQTFVNHISECLNVVPFIDEFTTSDPLFETVVDWYEDSHASTSIDPLDKTRFYTKIFTDYENSAGIKEIGMNYYDRMTEILKGWGCRMFMEDGMFKIHSVQAFRGLTKNYFRYNKSGGSLLSSGTYTSAQQTLTHPDNGGSDFYRLADTSIEYVPRLDQVKNTYKHKGSNNMLPPHEDYLDSAWYLTNKNIAATNNLRWKVKVRGYVRITNRYASTNWGGLKRSMKLRMRAYSDGSPSSVYLKKTILGSSISWNSSPNDYHFVTRLFNTADLLAGYQIVAPVSFEIETPTLPSGWVGSANVTNLTFKFIHGEWVNSTNTTPVSSPTTSTPDWNADPYDAAYANNVVVQWRAQDCEVVQYDSTESPIEETVYTADDGGGYTGANEYSDIEEIETIFGEPKGNAISGLQVYDGANWVESSSGWDVGSIAGSNAFGELLAVERMNGRYYPKAVWNTQLRAANLPFWKRYLMDSYNPQYFQMVRGEYILNEDLFKGELHRVQRDTGATASAIDYYGIDTVVDINPPVTFDPTGLTAAVDISDQAITNGDTVTTINTGGGVGQGNLPAGSTFLLINPVTGAKQTFVVASEVAEGDTSISVNSTTATSDFPAGSYIVIPPQTVATGGSVQNLGRINCGDSTAEYSWFDMLNSYREGLVPMINGGDSSSTGQETIYGGKSVI